jgi:hypothetical protein
MNSLTAAIFFALAPLAQAEPCEISANAVMKYEQRILSAIVRAPEKIDEPLKCLLEIQVKGEELFVGFGRGCGLGLGGCRFSTAASARGLI